MGRSLTTFGNSVIVQNAGDIASTTELNPHLQSGTPKQLPHGESRVCYAMLSRNTSSTWAGAVYFDKFFQTVKPATYNYSNNSQFVNNFYISDSTLQVTEQVMSNVTGTQSRPGSSSTSSYINATNAAGELGNAMVDVYSNATMQSVLSRNSSWNNKFYANMMYVNSNHKDQSIVYIMQGGTFRAISRIDGDYSYNRRGTSAFSISGVDSNMWGSASYNNTRKELIILSYVNSNGQYKLITYKGIDFDKYPSPHLAFTAPGVTRTEVSNFTLGANWSVNNNESYYQLKPVLTDNGDIFTTVFFTSSNFAMYKTVRSADATSVTSSTYQTTYSLTTSYGREQGIYYGNKAMQSRDGNAVLTFVPYYYYGAGIYSYIVDRIKNTYYQPTFMNSGNSSDGLQPVPYGDDGFATFYCGNGYAGNYTGNYITGMCNRNGSGNFEQSGTNIYMPYHTGPNTTNYPGFTQVVDYSMLTNQNVI